jgi:hypothetical protein
MRFWLEDYLPYLYRLAGDFLKDPDLHASWRVLRHWFLRRHARLERALRTCGMNYHAATQLYYSEVEGNLAGWIEESFAAAGCADLLIGHDLSQRLLSRPPALLHGEAKEPPLSARSPPPPSYGNRFSSGPGPGDSGSSWLALSQQRRRSSDSQ